MNAERKIARELAEKMADDRAHRIATMAAEELIRTEGEPTGDADKFLIPQCQADDYMRECIAHLVWHGEAMSEETEDGYVMVLFIDATVGAGFD
jgi:UTP:GlnB (protein PII) uridylyltransferase